MRVTHTQAGELVADQVAAEVRAEMARQGISQQALADRIGWRQNRLSRRITDGKTSVPFTVAELASVADALGVPLAKFLPTSVSAA